ncbi:MAG: TetR family transcriptional regulator [Streptosporangiales bacterium]|nr:TetR family transcriptional regulator [Streptosporangiales bacterium]
MTNNATDAVDHRKLPRRRGKALNTAIYQAALAELVEGGFAALTMERIAERARASKASLYRRWPSRLELVMDAVYHMLPSEDTVPDTGSLRGDLLTAFRSINEQLGGPVGEAFKVVLSDALRDPERGAEIRERARGNGVRVVREIAQRGVRRGEVSPDALIQRRLEAGQALLRHHFLFVGSVPDEVIVQIVDDVVLPLLHAPVR